MEGKNKDDNTDARKRKLENESKIESHLYNFELKQIEIPFVLLKLKFLFFMFVRN